MADKIITPAEAIGRFFPGGPLPKRPAKPYGSGKPIEFKDFNAYYDEFFNLLAKDTASPITSPLKPLLAELTKDFKQEGLTLTVESPSEATSESVPIEFADDIDDLPGSVAVTLNLNPVDWVKEPVKQSSTFLNSLVKGTFGYDIAKNTWSFTDVDNALERNFIWDPLVKGKNVGIGRLSSTGTKADAFANIVERKLTGRAITPTSTGIGLSDDLGEGLVDYTSPQKSYVIGVGEVTEPGNPIGTAQKEFINGMGKLNSEKTRETTFTTISTGFLNVLDKHAHKERDVSYILSPEANAMLKSRLVADSFGNKTPLLDLQGNDAISAETSRLKKLLSTKEEKEKKIVELNKEIADLGAKLSTTPPGKDFDQIEKELDKKVKNLNALPAEISNIDNTINISADNLLGTAIQAKDAITSAGLSPSTDKVLVDFGKTLEAVSKDKKTLLDAVEKNSLSKAVTSTRETLVGKVDASSGDFSTFAFREQYNYLKRLQGFDSNFKDPIKKLSRAELKKNPVNVTDEITALRKLCADELEAYKKVQERLKSNPDALKEFEQTFGSHARALEKLDGSLSTVDTPGDLKNLLSKYQSVYSTKTIGGGLKDVVTRKFTENVHFGKGPVSEAFSGDNATEISENSKRLFLITRNRYERESVHEFDKMLMAGPKGLIEPFVKKYVKERWGVYDFLSEPRSKFIRSNILEPTHFFGMSYSADKAAKFQETGGFVGWVESRIGEPLTRLWGKNNISVNVEGISFKMFGGSHLKGVVSLGGLFQSGAIDGATLELLLNAKDLSSLDSISALKGLKLPFGDAKSAEKFLTEIHAFKAWLKTEEGAKIAAFLGVSFNAQGRLGVNTKLAGFFRFIARLSEDPSSLDPTQFLVGRLKKLSQFLSRVQNKWIGLVANIRKPIVYLKVLITEGITEGLLAPLEGATGGLARFLRFAIKYVVSKAVDWGELLVRGILKFDLTEFYEAVNNTVKGSVQYILYFAVAPILIVVVLFDSVDVLTLGVSPVDNSRTDGILLGNCGAIDERAQGVGNCGVCGPSGSVDWSPYTLGSATFTEGIAFVIEAAANDFDIPAPLLAAVFYVEGWSENVPGKFEQPWTYDNVCSWSLDEGPLLPGCEERTSSSDARGSFQWIPAWFEQQIEASNVASLTPIPRGEYDPCNFLDAAYAAAGRFKELGNAAGVGGCEGWTAAKGTIGSGYNDSLPSTVTKAQWAILHYACGAGGSECFDPTFINYSEKGLAVFNSLKCF